MNCAVFNVPQVKVRAYGGGAQTRHKARSLNGVRTATAIQPVKVVIVDDSAAIRRRLSGMLGELSGVEVVAEAANAREGMELIRTCHPDVVVLDIRMPGGSGLGLLEDLKRSGVSVTTVVLTNYPYPTYRERCAELGANYFFDKSKEFDNLRQVVTDLVRGKS